MQTTEEILKGMFDVLLENSISVIRDQKRMIDAQDKMIQSLKECAQEYKKIIELYQK